MKQQNDRMGKKKKKKSAMSDVSIGINLIAVIN